MIDLEWTYLQLSVSTSGKERDLRVAVVHGFFFTEGDDSILSAFSWEPLRAKLQETTNKFLWLAD